MIFQSNKKEKIALIIILIIFVLLRIPGLELSYYQDEIKYAGINPIIWDPGGAIAHPPLTSIIFGATSKFFGPDYFRVMPFIFGLINFFLLWFLANYLFGRKAALWSVFILSLSFFGVLSSLMVDTDGQVLPFFTLLTFIGYLKWEYSKTNNEKIFWFAFGLMAMILGFLTKLSFVIPVAAVISDYFIKRKSMINKKLLIKSGLICFGILILMAAALFNATLIYPDYDISKTIAHAQDSIKFSNRAYLQIFIQLMKTIIYLSPLLIVPLFFISRKRLVSCSLFWFLIFWGIVFYVFLFDFSRAALDKYLQFLIIPLCLMSGVSFSDIFSNQKIFNKKNTSAGVLMISIIFLIQFIKHLAPPLYPKEEWINRIVTLKWNFVFPFTGGSGPAGFYVSWLFICVMWIVVILSIYPKILKNKIPAFGISLLLLAGIGYNAVFIEEYLFGKINGNSNHLLNNAIEFIKEDKNIKKVITYNDMGGKELNELGKYQRRLYAVPKYEKGYREIFQNFKGYYLVIDIPHINEESLYARYLSTCAVIREEVSGKITSKIYNCKNAKVI